MVSLFVWLYPLRIVSLQSKSVAMSSEGYVLNGKIFSGLLYQLSQENRLLRMLTVHKGRLHGFDIQWYPNGQRFVEKYYRDGREVGVHKSWYANGNVQYYKTFQDGVAHGDFFEWHTNGQVSSFIKYDQGAEVAVKTWTFKGKPFYNYVWSKNSKVGLQGDKFCAPRKKVLLD